MSEYYSLQLQAQFCPKIQMARLQFMSPKNFKNL